MENIELYDTTLRDGMQGEGVSLSTKGKLQMLHLLDAQGFQYIEGGWPGSNAKDQEFFARAQGFHLDHAKLSAFSMTRRKDMAVEDDTNIRELLAANTPVITLVGKSWDVHVTHALQTTLDENVRMIEDTVRFCKRHGREVIYDAEHSFDGLKKNPVYALRTMHAAKAAGADRLVLCDTNGGTLPHEIPGLIRLVRKNVDIPLGVHMHNDTGVAVANSLRALEEGVTHIQGTINGIGERVGNANLVTIMGDLQLKMGYACTPHMEGLTEFSRLVNRLVGRRDNPLDPYVGSSAFAHKGGMHVSAVLRDPSLYEHIDPSLVGNRRRFVISDYAGAANVVAEAQNLGYSISPEQAKEVLAAVKRKEHQGYAYQEAPASFEMLLLRQAGMVTELFTEDRLRVIVEREAETVVNEAVVSGAFGGEYGKAVAEGNGPVHALVAAFHKAMPSKLEKSLSGVHLVDYWVDIADPKGEEAASIRVHTELRCGTATWVTMGVGPNIILASFDAYKEGLNYYMAKCRLGNTSI